jgi:hopene-associated glycosyltransferase HpnB
MKRGNVWALGIAATSLGGWVILALGRGNFWRAEAEEDLAGDAVARRQGRVEAVVPARNEEKTIGRALRSLLDQTYAGPLAITVIDDGSSDATAAEARAAIAARPAGPRVDVVAGRPLLAPWTGKVNALDTGVASARESRGLPDYWLFTDADIAHHPDNVAELVAKMERDQLDLVSLMVRLRCESAWERLLVPAFIFFFRKLYPFAWSNDPARSTAAAAGGCILVRAAALERIGGLQSIADQLIDDCALAAAVKGSGGAIWLGLSDRTISLRHYETLAPLWKMVKRTAFVQLDRSKRVTLLAGLGMTVLYLAPPALALAGVARSDAWLASIAAAAWALMSILYVPTLRAYRRPVREALALPVAAALYTLMTFDSALAHVRGRGGAWKGRTYLGKGPSPA